MPPNCRKAEWMNALLVATLLTLSTFASDSSEALPASRSPKKFLFAIGGAGDTAGSTNIFTDNFVETAKKAKVAGYETDFLFDGVHPDARKKVAKAFSSQPTENNTFSQSNLKKMVERIQNKIKNGEIKTGDQIFFSVDTHGFPNETMATDDFNMGTPLTMKYDLLQDLAQELSKNKIQTAFYFGNCYSGSFLDKANPDICTLTASTKNNVSVVGDTDSFLKELESGKSLEDTFLEHRKPGWLFWKPIYGIPQISSPAGLATQQILKPLLESVDYTSFPYQASQCSYCESKIDARNPLGEQWPKFQNQIQQILAQATTGSNEIDSLLKDYKKALVDYRTQFREVANEFHLNELDQLKKKLKDLVEKDTHTCDIPLFGEKTTFVFKFVNPQSGNQDDYFSGKYNRREILESPCYHEAARLYHAKRNQYVQQLEQANAIKNRLDEIESNASKAGLYSTKVNQGHPIISKAQKVFAAEKALYLKLYEAYSEEYKDQPNPCRDFKF